MSLSKPAPRRLMHTREIDCRGYARDDGLWDIEARLLDIKSYSFPNHDRGGIHAGEPIHLMRVRVTLDEDLTIHDIEAVTEEAPFTLCPDIAGDYRKLKGENIGPGWIRKVRELVGKHKGCTHLTDILTGPIATTAFQTIVATSRNKEAPEDEKGRPRVVDTCHALAADGPVVARLWPNLTAGD
ncbi:DUF2889 domain-containing protein [Magnetospira sp. QH-2]|uniref:DUF2889 domain-containing protein n=1 Tax=Magnetospira sp. (strain QH-2) TaxID=1288970 RepID=UPI0003E80E33|nr:DUF2889 domain-containing protein [Magnetospira sp. QH-2]CCQ74630.1 conserved protein of unknown function [Magnetospira sp. QH-2]